MQRANDNRAYRALEERLARAGKLAAARAALNWDSQTYMPRGGGWARGEEIAVLSEAINDLTGDAAAADLIAEAEASVSALDPVEAANLAEARRLHTHAAATPTTLLGEFERVSATLYFDWVTARKTNDFNLFAAGFQTLLGLIREIATAKAEALGVSPYDACVDETDPGVNQALIDPIFADLEASLPALLADALERQAREPKSAPIVGDLSNERQMALSYRLAAAVGHIPEHSRIDLTAHPFSVPQMPGDVRFTTHFFADDPKRGIMATLHEAGHAMYEFNLPRALAFQPAGVARGGAVHESQSLMVEKQAGLSREFLGFLAGEMREAFGGSAEVYQVANVVSIFRAITPGFIRVDADEISYPLHVILRYRLEQSLLSGALAVADIPDAWNTASRALFGRVPPDHAHGCLQDVHWSSGLFGYFPSYTLGAALAAQLFERATTENGDILPGLARGDFRPYFDWVRPRVHERASTVDFHTLITQATGEPLSAAALKRRLHRRYVEAV